MKAKFVSALVAASVLAAGAAVAQSNSQGTIVALNSAQGEITLSNGDSFYVPASAQEKGLNVGDNVLVFVDGMDASMATSVVVRR